MPARRPQRWDVARLCLATRAYLFFLHTFTACVLDVSYTDPSGHSGTAHLTGVESTRIHANTVNVYFSSSSPRAAINPEQRIPSWAFVLFAVLVWFLLGLLAFAVYPRRRRRAAGRRPPDD
jgi:hypothetical protein